MYKNAFPVPYFFLKLKVVTEKVIAFWGIDKKKKNELNKIKKACSYFMLLLFLYKTLLFFVLVTMTTGRRWVELTQYSGLIKKVFYS